MESSPKTGQLHIPRRRSSHFILSSDLDESMPAGIPKSPSREEKSVPPRGRSVSPIRQPTPSDLRKAPSRTFVPPVPPTDVLDFPQLAHPRVESGIRLFSPLFMGGATAEGEALISVDGGITTARTKAKPPLLFGRITVSLIGIERSGTRQHIFQSLATDLIDAHHPPPITLAMQREPLPDGYWEVKPGSTALAFRIDLPILMGPPPYESKKLGILYQLSMTIEAKSGGKKEFVRTSKEVAVLSVQDPERTLVNLRTPLVVSDTLQISNGIKIGNIELTAGLHRQTWISGYTLFVDIHIANHSHKTIARIDLQLERAIAVYTLAAPSSSISKEAQVQRVPDRCIKDMLVTKSFREPPDIVFPRSYSTRTCELELPSGLVSVATGRFFGIRFFLNVQLLTTGFPRKKLKVQLPITLIHPNSIDIPPNAISQVTAAMAQHKYDQHVDKDHDGDNCDDDVFGYTRTGPDDWYYFKAGRAFTAAREDAERQSARKAMTRTEVNDLRMMLETSPRKRLQQEQRKQQQRWPSHYHGPRPDTNPRPRLHHRQSHAGIVHRSHDGGRSDIAHGHTFHQHDHHQRRSSSKMTRHSTPSLTQQQQQQQPRREHLTTSPHKLHPRVSGSLYTTSTTKNNNKMKIFNDTDEEASAYYDSDKENQDPLNNTIGGQYGDDSRYPRHIPTGASGGNSRPPPPPPSLSGGGNNLVLRELKIPRRRSSLMSVGR